MRRLVNGQSGGEGHSASSCPVGKAYRVSVTDQRPNVVDITAEHLGRDHRHRGARTADINRTGHRAHAAVWMNINGRGGLVTAVEPESRRHTASAIPALQF